MGPPRRRPRRRIRGTATSRTKMELPLFWVDAFTDRVFGGNPAAVVPLESWPEDQLLQRIAFENGLSETAYFVRTGPARADLRWFTPKLL